MVKVQVKVFWVVMLHGTAWHHNPEDLDLNSYCIMIWWHV